MREHLKELIQAKKRALQKSKDFKKVARLYQEQIDKLSKKIKIRL